MTEQDSAERVVIVTGSASVVGRGMALELAAGGMAVAVADINMAGASNTLAMIGAAGKRAIAMEMDVLPVVLSLPSQTISGRPVGCRLGGSLKLTGDNLHHPVAEPIERELALFREFHVGSCQ